MTVATTKGRAGSRGRGPRWRLAVLCGPAIIATSILTCSTVASAAPAGTPLPAGQACSTANPAANDTVDFPTDFTPTDQAIQTAFTNARKAEGCNVPLVLPASYDAMSPQLQVLWLVNSEREVRGLPDLQLDGTLMSQIALNHSREMAQYGYFDHPSPINQLQDLFARDNVNPALAPASAYGEDIGIVYPPATMVYGFMYDDSSSGWGHRLAILNSNFNWVGIGALLNAPGSQNGNYYTLDFLQVPNYTPPTTVDTGGPVLGAVTYSNGTATVSGVADNPANVNDVGANPATAGVTGVVFYTNNIVETGSTFNTVAATQTAAGSGTWTAPITVNPGDVLHAVAVDGSGNFTDVAMAAAPVALTQGANTVTLPAAAGGATGTAGMARTYADTQTSADAVPAVTRTAAALVRSVDRQLHRRAVTYVRVYVDGRWRTYRPGGPRRTNFSLYTGQGIVLGIRGHGRWTPYTGQQSLRVPRIRLHRGWNFVGVPYPVEGMTCHAVRFELRHLGDRLQEISIGTRPNTGVIFKPVHGSWGDDLLAHIPYTKGFWIKDAGSATWLPNPVQYGPRTPAIR